MYTKFMYNFISTNTLHGMYFTNNTLGSIIAFNSFKDNNLGGTSQAYDDGEGNVWFDEEHHMGNHWSGWIGEDYPIDGLACSVDLYPLDENLERLPSTSESHLLYSVLSIWLVTLIVKYLRKKPNIN